MKAAAHGKQRSLPPLISGKRALELPSPLSIKKKKLPVQITDEDEQQAQDIINFEHAVNNNHPEYEQLNNNHPEDEQLMQQQPEHEQHAHDQVAWEADDID